MKQQDYSNHVRYYIPHHFIFYPLMLAAFGVSLWFVWTDAFNRLVWIAIAACFLSVTALSFMLRQHYALNNQNRIVRLELRLRYYLITQKRFEEVEKVLSPGQIYALRFASDEELGGLTNRAISERLTPAQIKRAIKSWLPDEMRA